MALINVGGRMFDSSTKFRINDGYGGYETTAAQAAQWINRNRATQDYNSKTGWSTYEGGVDALGDPVTEQEKKKPAPKAEVPAHRGGGGGGSRRRESSGDSGGSGNALVDNLLKKIDELTGKKANSALPDKDGKGNDPYGIEDTKLNQLAPETVSRSFLTNYEESEPAAVSSTQNASTPEEGRSFLNSGSETRYSYNQVVDPATGKTFASKDDAKAAGITNWVYKFQYDRKNAEAMTTGAIDSNTLAQPQPGTPGGAVESMAMLGDQWRAQKLYRNRYSTNAWYKG